MKREVKDRFYGSSLQTYFTPLSLKARRDERVPPEQQVTAQLDP